MPKRAATFQLQATVDRATDAVNHALAELDWNTTSDQGVISTREDPTGLCCSMSPVEATIALTRDGGSATRIDLEVSVPGFGPGPKRQLVDRCAGLEQRIRRWESTLAASSSAV